MKVSRRGFAAFVVVGIAVNRPERKAPWILLSLATLAFISGDTGYAVLTEIQHKENPFPSWPDIIYEVYYVLLVVPIQTMLSLFLAVLVNRQILRGRGFFRTAFYFPSVTSSVAITVLWLFLFSASGAVNKLLAFVGVNGPNWFNDPSGVLHNILGVFGVENGPAALTGNTFLGISFW